MRKIGAFQFLQGSQVDVYQVDLSGQWEGGPVTSWPSGFGAHVLGGPWGWGRTKEEALYDAMAKFEGDPMDL